MIARTKQWLIGYFLSMVSLFLCLCMTPAVAEDSNSVIFDDAVVADVGAEQAAQPEVFADNTTRDDSSAASAQDAQAVQRKMENPVSSAETTASITPQDQKDIEAGHLMPDASEPSEYPEQVGDTSRRISISFAPGTDIGTVLKALADEANINIIMSRDVQGPVSGISLNDIPWESALRNIVRTYGFAYEKDEGNTVIVAPIDVITERKKKEIELNQVQPVETQVYTLEHIDAGDAMKVVESLLSPRGTVQVLEITGMGGWQFLASRETGKLEQGQQAEKRKSLSKKLIVTDIKDVHEKIKTVLKHIDVLPKQVMIETNIVEVDWHMFNDIGAQIFTGVDSPSNITLDNVEGTARFEGKANTGSVNISPKYYSSLSEASGTGFLDAGGTSFLVQKLTGSQFTYILRALEEKANANILSAPKILTLSNQEAKILVGQKYPIIETSVEQSSSTSSVSVNLSYYQDLGVQLNVVPQVNKDDYINMIVHPAVIEEDGRIALPSINSQVGTGGGDAGGDSDSSLSQANYPILKVREAETQLVIKSGQTIAIGGLMRDNEKESVIRTPLLSDIPILGNMFKRKIKYKNKNDLFIFITASVVSPEDLDVGSSEIIPVSSMVQ